MYKQALKYLQENKDQYKKETLIEQLRTKGYSEKDISILIKEVYGSEKKWVFYLKYIIARCIGYFNAAVVVCVVLTLSGMILVSMIFFPGIILASFALQIVYGGFMKLINVRTFGDRAVGLNGKKSKTIIIFEIVLFIMYSVSMGFLIFVLYHLPW